MNQEFLQAAELYGKQHRRVVLAVEIVMATDYNGQRQGRMSVTPYRPFLPKWFLIEPISGVIVRDVLYTNRSQFAGHGPVPAAFYSIDAALKLFDSPDSPAWDRFKLEPDDGQSLAPHDAITVHLEDTEPSVDGHGKEQIVHCLFIGDEIRFRKWEGKIQGTLTAVSLTEHGSLVEVRTSTGVVKVPIAPSDIPKLSEKIGRPVKFLLSTED